VEEELKDTMFNHVSHLLQHQGLMNAYQGDDDFRMLK
jgi:hypothetical protein